MAYSLKKKKTGWLVLDSREINLSEIYLKIIHSTLDLIDEEPFGIFLDL